MVNKIIFAHSKGIKDLLNGIMKVFDLLLTNGNTMLLRQGTVQTDLQFKYFK